MLAAFEDLAARDEEAVLLVAGREGSAAPELAIQYQMMRFRDRVRFLGHRDDIPVLLQVADVVVCSSYREGAAGALIEAMASGTPIVTTRLSGLEDVLIDGINAVVVAPGELATGILSVLGDPLMAERLAQRARADFAARFTVEQSAQALLAVYRWAARR